MPLGSSSLAPVMSPGPNSCKKPIGPFRFERFPPATSSACCWPGLTSERIGSGSGSAGVGVVILADSQDIMLRFRARDEAYWDGHNLARLGTVVTTSRRDWPADTVTDRMRPKCHRE